MQLVASGASEPKLSVITPSFNFARFLPETLDSVAALDASHEHIVVDGGSTDETVEILQARKDPSLVWVSEPDRGQAHAVNKGLERARGELLAWLNADDVYIPEHVDGAIDVLREDPAIDAAFGFTHIVDEQGHILKRYRCGPFSWSRYLYFSGYLPTVTIIFRRSLLARAPRLDERYPNAPDYDFYLRLLRGARVRRVRQPLVRFRYHPRSKTASDAALQTSEALKIRLRYARNGAERWLMHAANRATLARDSIFPPWPELPDRR